MWWHCTVYCRQRQYSKQLSKSAVQINPHQRHLQTSKLLHRAFNLCPIGHVIFSEECLLTRKRGHSNGQSSLANIDSHLNAWLAMANVGWWGKVNLNAPKGVMPYVPSMLGDNFSHHWLPHKTNSSNLKHSHSSWHLINLIKPCKKHRHRKD